MDDSLLKRLVEIDWAGFETAYGPAVKVPTHLANLFSPDATERLDATHALWCGLCHAYVSSAALPALPFLFEALDRTDDATAVEILDILAGFAYCTRPDDYGGAMPDWVGALRQNLAPELPRFRQLATHVNADISYFAGFILKSFGETPPGKL